MTGAELKVSLQGFGVSPGWFGKRCGVTMRTVVRWFDLDEIPERAVAELKLLSAETLAEMRAMIGADNTAILRTYRTDNDIWGGHPASWHRALTFRVLEHLRAQGREVRVEYFSE